MNNQYSNKGAASSAAKMNKRFGVAENRYKFLVEGGKWVSAEQLKRDAAEGLQHFQNNFKNRQKNMTPD